MAVTESSFSIVNLVFVQTYNSVVFLQEIFAEKYGLERFASVFYTMSHCNWIGRMCVLDEDMEEMLE